MGVKQFKTCDCCNSKNQETVLVDLTMYGVSTTHEICTPCLNRVTVGQLYKAECIYAGGIAHG